MYGPDYEKYKARYERGGCTKEQLRRLIELDRLTPAGYEAITGEPHEQSN